MNIVIFILVVGLALRTVLDLATLNNSNLITDVLYTVLYGSLGVVMLVGGQNSVFGYGAILIAMGWSIHGFFRFKKQMATQN